MPVDRFHRVAAVVLAAVVLAVAGCGGGGGERSSPDEVSYRQDGTLNIQPLNSISGQRFRYRVAGSSITVTAPTTNSPVELGRLLDQGRDVIGEAFWRSDQTARIDQQVCVVLRSVMNVSSAESAEVYMKDPTERHLSGVALRIRPGGGGAPTRAITVTQSLYNAAVWNFEVNGVATDVVEGHASAAVTNVATVDFGDAIGRWTGEAGSDSWSTTMSPPRGTSAPGWSARSSRSRSGPARRNSRPGMTAITCDG